jgi:predicted enzyme related to lactoylglutathione lyase
MLTTKHLIGTPVWVDVGVPDVDAAAAFYRSLFGWEFVSAGPEAGGYGFFTLGGRMVAAAGPLMEPDAAPEWTLSFLVTDVDGTAAAVERAGGTVRMAPMDVMDQGRLATFTDPTGARFAVWQPRGNQGLEVVNDPGSLCWTELYTTDTAAATAFYRALFDWDMEESQMPGGIAYTVVSPAGGGQETSFGGIMALQEENRAAGSTSEWHPYFEVTDCDAVFAKAAEGGASTLIPPMDVPDVGRMAMFQDPAGATCAVITSSAG